MPQSNYPAAKLAAPSINRHLVHHPGADNGVPVAARPDLATIEAITTAGFWASLRREEGRTPQLSLAYVAPDQVKYPLMLEKPLSLASYPLTKVAPAVERPGIHLGVWHNGDELSVWGATRNLPAHCFVVEVVIPGVLVVKQSPADDSGKYVNVAVLAGDDIKIINQQAAKVPDCPDLLTSLLGFESQHDSPDTVNVIIQLAVSMRAHGRGGSLLVVPGDSETWRESIVHPITFSVSPAFSALTDLMEADDERRSMRRWQDGLRRAIDAIAGLTAVDGATVITDKYQLLAFGAKIMRRPGAEQITKVILTEPVEGVEPEVLEPAQLGGTRHLSAAQFAQDQPDAVSLVASQDGRFTVFAYSACEKMVHAHRIETLLL